MIPSYFVSKSKKYHNIIFNLLWDLLLKDHVFELLSQKQKFFVLIDCQISISDRGTLQLNIRTSTNPTVIKIPDFLAMTANKNFRGALSQAGIG